MGVGVDVPHFRTRNRARIALTTMMTRPYVKALGVAVGFVSHPILSDGKESLVGGEESGNVGQADDEGEGRSRLEPLVTFASNRKQKRKRKRK